MPKDQSGTASERIPAEYRTELGGDAQPSLMDIALDFRVDGNDEVIEFDLRDADEFGPLAEVLELPKLRSLLLTNSTIGDDELKIIGQLQHLENLDLRGCPVSDAGLAHLSELPKLKAIKLSGKNGKTTVTDEGIESLSGITTLKVLAADFLSVTDQGIASLGELKQMRELYLAGTKVSGKSAETIQGFASLSKLRVASTQFDDSGLSGLASSLSELAELDVSECAMLTDAAADSLVQFPKLAKLNLYATPLGDKAMETLATANQLTWLNVDKTAISDASLQAIGQLEGLKFLHLGSTKVSDAGLDSLIGLKQLDKLIVTRTEVTQAGVQQLSTQLPTTEIQLKYDPDE